MISPWTSGSPRSEIAGRDARSIVANTRWRASAIRRVAARHALGDVRLLYGRRNPSHHGPGKIPAHRPGLGAIPLRDHPGHRRLRDRGELGPAVRSDGAAGRRHAGALCVLRASGEHQACGRRHIFARPCRTAGGTTDRDWRFSRSSFGGRCFAPASSTGRSSRKRSADSLFAGCGQWRGSPQCALPQVPPSTVSQPIVS